MIQQDVYWQAVLAHDRRYDDAFVYAVRSTGVYCKASCPSRRPRREQVRFFTRPAEAQEAGFRPCRRCQLARTNDEHETMVQRLCRYIEVHSDEPLSLDTLSAEVHLSPTYMQRVFKQIMGITPRQYQQSCRMAQLKTEMKEGKGVTSALYEVGFGSSSRLYEQATTQLGMTPGAYRKHGKGMAIRYTLVNCPLGRLLVGATEKGLCSVCLGDTDSTLEQALYEEYRAATITRDDDALQSWVHAVLQQLAGHEPQGKLPLDVQATAFQRRVWEALQAIPSGETRSYAELAAQLGDVRKARAVAQACASNPVALVVPCHRVVRGDGSLGGYRWGMERKKQLLMKEKAESH